MGGDPPEGTWAPYQSQKEISTPNVISGMIWNVYISVTAHLDGREWANLIKFVTLLKDMGGKNMKKTISKTRRLTHRPFAHHWLQMLSANSIPSEPCSQRCGPTARCCEDPCATCRAVFLCDVETRPWKMCGVGDSRSHEVKKFQTKSNKWILKRTINGI